jgi:hypothetical protein
MLMARLQTRRQGLKQVSLTSIVSTSGGLVHVTVEQLQLRARVGWLAAIACIRRSRVARAIHKYKMSNKNLKKLLRISKYWGHRKKYE